MITLRFLLVLLLAGSASASDLQTRLEKMAAAHPGKVALFAKNLTTGETVAINADTPVKTASVIKLPIMVEAFAEVKEGKRSLDDKVTLRGEEKVFGSGVFHFLRDGLQLTVEETIWNMMIFSDNTATNLMINMPGSTRRSAGPPPSPCPPTRSSSGWGRPRRAKWDACSSGWPAAN
jgi:beta-lactamase class A